MVEAPSRDQAVGLEVGTASRESGCCRPGQGRRDKPIRTIGGALSKTYKRLYVIGDIHGRLDLDQLIAAIGRDVETSGAELNHYRRRLY